MGSAVCNICMNALTLKVGVCICPLISEFVNFWTEELYRFPCVCGGFFGREGGEYPLGTGTRRIIKI